jgi:hypothetical protein
MRFPGFIGPSYISQSVNVDCQRCVNLFPEINDLGTGKEREVASLVPTPGLTLLCTLPEDAPVRGLYRASNGTLFAASGIKFYSVSSDFVVTELGELSTSSGPIAMADNGLHVFIVDGTYGYTWTFASSVFEQVTDEDFYPSDTVTFQDGYFIFTKKDSQQFFYTDINNVTVDPLDIGTAEGTPDNLVGAISGNQNLFLFGTQTTEIYYNSGDADSPFQRIQGAINGVGCAAVHSIEKIQGIPYWVGGDESGTGIVYRMRGYQAERISTPAIESVIRALAVEDLANARAWTYQQGGHHFYCLNIPGADSTWVYDASTSLWHERQYLDSWFMKRHRADCHALAYSKNVVGDFENGKIYELDQDAVTDNGTSIARIRRSPHFSQGLVNIFHHSFQLDMETGVGTDGVGQGTNPKALLRYSDDGGHTWSQEREAYIGKIGQKNKRVIWRRLGVARDRVYEVKVTDPVKVVLIGAELSVEEGIS